MTTQAPIRGAPARSSGAPIVVGLGLLVAFMMMMGVGAAFFLTARPAAAPVAVSVTAVAVAPEPAPREAKPSPPPSPVTRVLSFGEEGTNPGQLHAPTQLAVSSDGAIFVAENATGRVQRFGANGAYQAAVVMPPDKLTKQNGIFGMTTDSSGKLYVNRVGDVLVYDAITFAEVRLLAGDYPDRYYHGGLAVDGTGNVHALTDRMGDVDLVTTSVGGKILAKHRVSATDVAVDGTGNVFLVNREGIEVLDAKGAVVSKVGGVHGRSVAFDGKGHVFVGTGSSVEVLGSEGSRVISLPVHASEIALDRAGRLYALEGSGVSVYEVKLP